MWRAKKLRVNICNFSLKTRKTYKHFLHTCFIFYNKKKNTMEKCFSKNSQIKTVQNLYVVMLFIMPNAQLFQNRHNKYLI